MKKRKYIMGLLSTMLLAIACSESLEDTYGDYTDGGRIRYVGKCYDVKTVPGWKRLTLNWKSGRLMTGKIQPYSNQIVRHLKSQH